MSVPTPHIEAKINDFAKTVIMPGDPKRAEWIAKTFLTDAKLVNSVRGILGYTGKYKNKEVSVMASGMGNASMGIYSYELFKFYNVDNIIRIGTCGTYEDNLNLGDFIICEKSVTNTNYCNMFSNKIFEVDASKKIFEKAKLVSKQNGIKINIGNIFCSDTFYSNKMEEEFIKQNNCLGVEMESAALYYNAKMLNKNALTICSVSDNIVKKTRLTSTERQNSLKDMVLFALELV